MQINLGWATTTEIFSVVQEMKVIALKYIGMMAHVVQSEFERMATVDDMFTFFKVLEREVLWENPKSIVAYRLEILDLIKKLKPGV
jgi:hypothetical protein